jgi:hypothetical protein
MDTVVRQQEEYMHFRPVATNSAIAGAGMLLFFAVAALNPATAEVQVFDCKDPILNETAFHLRIDSQRSVVTLESTPTSIIAPDEIHTFPAQSTNGTLKWSMPQLPGTLEFFFDRKTGAVMVDRLLVGRRESYASFTCAKAVNANPETLIHPLWRNR